MSSRIRALIGTSAISLAACSQDARVTAPSIDAARSSFVINPAVACNGATMPVAECAALVAVYNSTNGAGWKSSENWGVNPNPCTWHGVTCTGGATGSVKELELANNWLSGSLPAALNDLTAAEHLQFQGNAITGSLPSLANLANLRILNVNANGMTGPVPAWLGSLTNLESIHLGWNSFSGSIPSSIGNLTALKTLFLNDNQLSGNIPPQLGAITGLYGLDLKNNQLTGSIPTELGNLVNLTVLTLSENQLTGSIPAAFGNLTSAHQVLLQGNDLTGLVPLGFAVIGGPIPNGDGFACIARPGNAGLYMPDTPAYRAADTDGDGFICDIPFAPADDIGEDAIDEIEELVPTVLNEGQANALQTKIDNAMEKAAKGQFGAAINQMQSFLGQLGDMVGSGTLTPAQAAPFIDQAESLIAIWTAELP